MKTAVTRKYEIPFGEPDVKKEGKDITFLTIGHTLYPALQAAKELEEKYGMNAEVIDARSKSIHTFYSTH